MTTQFDDAASVPLRSLGAIFLVPENGSSVHDTMVHIAALGQGDRLWFERCTVVGTKVLAPHEHCTDGKPSALSIPALRRRFGCDARAAFEYGELLLALEADRQVIAHYAHRVDREGMEAVCRELRGLVVELDLVEGGADPVEEADALPAEGREAAAAEDGTGDTEDAGQATLGYHVVGNLFGEEDAERPWEAKEPVSYRTLLTRIARAPKLEVLTAVAEAIRTRSLTREQAAVAWTAWRIRREHLEASLPLGRVARGILARIGRANGTGRELARLGSWLYRAQRTGSPTLVAHEWRTIWNAYRARRHPEA